MIILLFIVIANLLTEILNFTVYIVVAHPLVVAYQVHKIAVCICIVIWLRIVAIQVNHNYV